MASPAVGRSALQVRAKGLAAPEACSPWLTSANIWGPHNVTARALQQCGACVTAAASRQPTHQPTALKRGPGGHGGVQALVRFRDVLGQQHSAKGVAGGKHRGLWKAPACTHVWHVGMNTCWSVCACVHMCKYGLHVCWRVHVFVRKCGYVYVLECAHMCFEAGSLLPTFRS